MLTKEDSRFTKEEARQVGDILGIDWHKFDIEQFRIGLEIELEHGRDNPITDVTHDDLILTGKIVLTHLGKFPDYYTRLAKMKTEARHDYHCRKLEPREWR